MQRSQMLDAGVVHVHVCFAFSPQGFIFLFSCKQCKSLCHCVCLCVCVQCKTCLTVLEFFLECTKKTHQTTQEALFSARWIIRCKSLGRLGTVQQKCFGQVTPSDTDDTDNHKAATQLKRARLFITKRGINFKGI